MIVLEESRLNRQQDRPPSDQDTTAYIGFSILKLVHGQLAYDD